MRPHPSPRRPIPDAIPVTGRPSLVSAVAVLLCLAALTGCVLDSGGVAPSDAEGGELRQGVGANPDAPHASLCTRNWNHALADTVWICPDPKPPGAP